MQHWGRKQQYWPHWTRLLWSDKNSTLGTKYTIHWSRNLHYTGPKHDLRNPFSFIRSNIRNKNKIPRITEHTLNIIRNKDNINLLGTPYLWTIRKKTDLHNSLPHPSEKYRRSSDHKTNKSIPGSLKMLDPLITKQKTGIWLPTLRKIAKGCSLLFFPIIFVCVCIFSLSSWQKCGTFLLGDSRW